MKECSEERYIVLSGKQIKDTLNNSESFLSENKICDLLNQQYKRIKELEEENTYFRKEMLRDGETFTPSQAKYIDEIIEENQRLKDRVEKVIKDCNNLFIENSKLNQQSAIVAHRIYDRNEEILRLKNLINEIIEKLKEKQPNFTENDYGFATKQGWDMCVETLDTILKKYGDENE